MSNDSQDPILDMNQANIFLSRFINNDEASSLQHTNGSYTAHRTQRITPALLEQHLSGEITLGVYAINPANNTSRWLCFDSDEESEESFAKLINWFDSFGIPSYRESRRPGRSGHLWVFMEAPISSPDAFKILHFGKFCYKFKGEIFPHSEKLLTPDKLGLLVRLPLGIHRKLLPSKYTGLFACCPDRDVYEQLKWLIRQPVASQEAINRLLLTIPVTKPPVVRKRGPKSSKSVLDMFPDDWIWREINGELRGACPACRAAGGDRAADNLYVNVEKNVLHCFFSNGVHTFAQIRQAARQCKSSI